MANSTGDSPCTRDNRFDTFPINFLMIFFVIGFGSSFVSCMFVNRFSYIKFIPILLAVIFETVLALLVGLLKADHTEELLFELYQTLNCYKRKNGPLDIELDIIHKFNLKSMDVVQTRFNCCGVTSYEDWIEASGVIPYSCCVSLEYCSLKALKEKPGCFIAMKRDVYSNWNAMIMFIIIFVFIKLIILALYICNAITHITEMDDQKLKEEGTRAADDEND